MDLHLTPHCSRVVASYNPLDWAVVVSREALAYAPNRAVLWPRLGALAVTALVMGWPTTRAFGAYQRSA